MISSHLIKDNSDAALSLPQFFKSVGKEVDEYLFKIVEVRLIIFT